MSETGKICGAIGVDASTCVIFGTSHVLLSVEQVVAPLNVDARGHALSLSNYWLPTFEFLKEMLMFIPLLPGFQLQRSSILDS